MVRPYDIQSPFKKVTPIGYRYDSNRDDIPFVGTGFFYYHQRGVFDYGEANDYPGSGPYLISNKHVLAPRGYPNPDEITIVHPSNRGGSRENIRLKTPEGQRQWTVHPDKDDVDISVLPLNLDIKSRHAFHRADIPPHQSVVSGGDSAYVIGYPDPLPEFNSYPVLRSALISSPYELAYTESSYFYTDARLHEGMSGSPVLATPVKTTQISEAYVWDESSEDDNLQLEIEEDTTSAKPGHPYLLGVHSGEEIHERGEVPLDELRELVDNSGKDGIAEKLRDFESRLTKFEQKTGLNTVWHSKLLDDIIRNQ